MAVAAATQTSTVTEAPGPKHNIEAMREAFYGRIAKKDMAPLWKVMRSVVTNEPVTRYPAACLALWRRQIAGHGIRRPDHRRGGRAPRPDPGKSGMHGESRITNTLFAGIQMIMPGEVAPAHRHVSSAIRFILDGEGAYTAVEGEKAFMAPGDFVITANWAPHDHGNPSKEPMLWLDVLDFPAVNFYEASFAEHFDDATQETTRKDGDSLSFYGSGVLPDGTPTMNRSPVINYTYARTRPIIERMMQSGDIDKRHGARVRYANPVTGGPVLPTMGACLAMLPKGFEGEPYRATDGTVFVCVEGEGTTTVDGKVLEWGKNDVFVVPSWKRYAHNAPKQSVLFSISDRPAQEALGIWREGK